MSDYQASQEANAYTAKMIVGAGVGFVGWLTLENAVMITGILCSLAVTGHTLWRWWSEWRDRAAKKAAAAAEPWV